jgi:hypothetical protein
MVSLSGSCRAPKPLLWLLVSGDIANLFSIRFAGSVYALGIPHQAYHL